MVKVLITPELKLVIFYASASVTFEEIVSQLQENVLNKEWVNGFSILIDLRHMTSTVPLSTYEQLQSYISSFEKCREVKQAILVNSFFEDEMCHEWMNLAKNKNLQYRDFFDPQEAAEWLGADFYRLTNILNTLHLKEE